MKMAKAANHNGSFNQTGHQREPTSSPSPSLNLTSAIPIKRKEIEKLTIKFWLDVRENGASTMALNLVSTRSIEKINAIACTSASNFGTAGLARGSIRHSGRLGASKVVAMAEIAKNRMSAPNTMKIS